MFKSTFSALINEDYFIGNDTRRCQSILEHAISKIDFPICADIYMIPSNLNLNIEKPVGYNNDILISNIDKNKDKNKATINRQNLVNFNLI